MSVLFSYQRTNCTFTSVGKIWPVCAWSHQGKFSFKLPWMQQVKLPERHATVRVQTKNVLCMEQCVLQRVRFLPLLS